MICETFSSNSTKIVQKSASESIKRSACQTDWDIKFILHCSSIIFYFKLDASNRFYFSHGVSILPVMHQMNKVSIVTLSVYSYDYYSQP